MAEFKPGDIVDITITGARVVEQKNASLEYEYVSVPDDDPEEVVYERTRVDTRSPAVNVARITPAEWPPHVGDLWRDRDGTLWFAVEDDGSSPFSHTGLPYLVHGARDVFPAVEVRENWSPLALVHRETPEAES